MSHPVVRHVIVSLILHVMFVAWLGAHGTSPTVLAIMGGAAVSFTTASGLLIFLILQRQRGAVAQVTDAQAGFWATVNLIERQLDTAGRARAAATLQLTAEQVDAATAATDALRVCRHLGPINRRRVRAAIIRCEALLPGAHHVLYAMLAHGQLDPYTFDALTDGWTWAGLPIYCPTPVRATPAGTFLEATS